MAGPFYVDPAGDNSDGLTWAKAKTTLAAGYALAGAGEIVYCRGTETMGATATLATAGSEAAGYVKVIGCNASTGAVDGTTYKMNADGNAYNISCNVINQWFQNIEVYGSTTHGWAFASSFDYSVLINCIARNNTGTGFYALSSYNKLIKCRSYTNGASGFTVGSGNNLFLFCVSYDNTDDGFVLLQTGQTCIGCVAHDNGASDNAGFSGVDIHGVIFNCVADGEVYGVALNDASASVFGTRMTNCSTNGLLIDTTADCSVYGWNVFDTNTADVTDLSTGSSAIPDDADTDTNEYDPDADDGYNNKATHDFNLKATRTYNGEADDAIDLNFGS